MFRILFLVFVACDASEYYHEKSHRDFTVVIRPEANFGFSISSTSSSSTSKLVVGAPLADNIGSVYTCDLTNNNANACTNVERNISRFTDTAKYGNQNYWFGATVKGADNFFVGCAPLNIEMDTDIFGHYPVGTYGRCYRYRYDGSVSTQLKSLTGKKRKENFTKFEETIDSFGWSLFIEAQDDSVLIGGPAMISGRVIRVASNNDLRGHVNGSTTGTAFNFGYDVASSDKFFKQSKPVPIIVSGSTYGYDGHGRVTFVRIDLEKERVKTEKNNAYRKVYVSKEVGQFKSESVGSMFGAVLCPATLTASRLTDLLVGAPTYATGDSYNVGAVHVYIAKATALPTFKKTIVGTGSQSYFGQAIVNVGDLNKDGFDDIAVGAPYESNGRGAVYLYCGADLASDDRTVVPLQKISPEPALRTFGYSLTAINDYDDNGCNELAIGAPVSNTVKLLRCMAGIRIHLLKLKTQITGTTALNKTEDLPVCIAVTFSDKPIKVNTDIVVKVEIKHDGASLKDPANGILIFNVQRSVGKKKETFCQNISLFISTNGDYNKHVAYNLTASLAKDIFNERDFQSHGVILSKKLSILSRTGSIWIQECGNRNCVPKLAMTTTFSEDTPYTIGSSRSINATVLVVNTGEVAYDPCVFVEVTGASVPRPPDECRLPDEADENNRLECRPRQLLRKTNPPWSLDVISVDTSQLNNKNKIIEVSITLHDVCSSQNVTQQINKVYQLLADTDSVEVHGCTDESLSDIVNLTKSDIAIEKPFEHIYTISNNGPTTWVDVNVAINVLKQDFFTTFVYLENQVCQLDNTTESDQNVKYTCLAKTIGSGAGIKVRLRMHVVKNKISDRIGKEKLTVHSDIIVDLDGVIKSDSVTSELRLVVGEVPIWIIIVACILALIVLVIIALILRECGFLKRKNREDLKRAKMSVHRQTLIRHSIGSRPRSNDQKKLVDADEVASTQDNTQAKKDRRMVVKDS